MKSIFRKSVQIFKDKKDKDGVYINNSGGNNDGNGSNNGKSSPSSSLSKKDKKNKHGNNIANTDFNNEYNQGYHNGSISSNHSGQSPTLTREDSISSYNSDSTTISAASSPPIFIHNPNARKVFGVPLSQVPCRPGSNVPIIIERLVDHIEKTSLTTEGLFRIPGREVTINQYINLYNNGEDVDVSPIEPYTAAGLLKRFFRDLPVFVPQSINRRVASLFVSEDGKKKPFDMEILGNLRILVHQLPTVHFEVMQALTGLLAKIMSKSDENKMTISNIAICLVPTLNCVPAIVTYPIQYFNFFFNEIFQEHHIYHMRPYQTNLISTAIEERLEHLSHLSTQPMLIPNNNNSDVQKRYSRPASITISGLLPTQNQSPSSSTITSTTITSPHDSTTPITFTVTTTFSPQDQQNGSPSQIHQHAQQQLESGSGNQQPTNTSTNAATTTSNRDRRTYKIDPNEYAQFLEETQYNINKNYLHGGNTSNNLSQSSSNISPSTTITNNNTNNNNNNNNNINNSYGSNSSETNKLYRRSVAYTGGNIETKAAIQQIKEKIDRYSKEKKTREDKEREKLLRYSIDLERYKDRYNKEKRSSRDINKEIEREIEKRLSPRERLNLLLASNNGTMNLSSSVNSTLNRSSISGLSSLMNSANINDTSSNSGSNRRMSITQQLQMQLQQLQQQQQAYQQQQQSTTPMGLNNNTTTTSTTTNSNRYSSNRYKAVGDLASSSSSFRYSREIYDDDYYSNNNMMFNNNFNDNMSSISGSSASAFSRQRSQSCFEPESLIQQLTLQQQQYQQQQQQQSYQQPYQMNPQYSNAFIEQKLDQIRDTINNLHRDNRVSRDYTHYLREVEDLRETLQKETVTTEFFANKNQELEDKLRREEEKNKRLVEEIQLLESYFVLKEKSKLSKRLSTRSRSPTLHGSFNHNNDPLNSSSNSIHSYVSNNVNLNQQQTLNNPNNN
ncbi:hypothetical protein DICPUDRAFT_97430 [Dictyostelium purpureum]|uniref:Rho-GAP domain-containing protein n=1 Tax=Dictyostelium purpureum TaxID=5786 RepID=F0ZGN0_DICPU|nr:uncharacterized protein DICPUDRAFT_97430 [Dictyostelium purpureum]EGC36914.1 hypothetical protein DICPUDRAFT_97430 [Dictyostelium purpureum]|eukprot:XP_003286557.1 hypothetical protein DICPUDRAFT_97430 [Dictyostelium purpureum]